MSRAGVGSFFDWGVAYGSRYAADPIHHIVEGGRMLCSGNHRVHVTHHDTGYAPRPCERCIRRWKEQASDA